MPEKDNLSFETLKLSAVNTLKKGLAIGGSVLALAGGTLVREAVFNPAEATAAVECTATETTTTDGTTTTTTETTHCADDGGDSSGTTADQPPETPSDPGKGHNHSNDEGNGSNKPDSPKHGSSIKQPKNPVDNEHHKFISFDQPTGNTCYSASFAMIAATLDDNPHITPMKIATSKQIRPHFTIKGGVVGQVYDTIPALSKRFKLNVSPQRSGFGETESTLEEGGLSMVLFAGPGHFASGSGHFLVIKREDNGRFIISDPNGHGRSGDSERKKGWTAGQLKAGGAIAVWNFTAKH